MPRPPFPITPPPGVTKPMANAPTKKTALIPVPSFEPEDLSVKESTEAEERWGLDPSTYCELKQELFWKMVEAAEQEAERKASEQVEKKILDRAVAKAKEEVREEVRRESFKEFKEEWAKERPNEEDKLAYGAGARDLEVECLVYATSASKESQDELASRKFRKRTSNLVLASVLLGAGPYLLWLTNSFGWGSFPFLLYLAPVAVLGVLSLLARMPWERWTSSEGYYYEDPVLKLKSRAAAYLQLSQRCRRLRTCGLHTGTRSEAEAELDYIQREKKELDSKYHPTVTELQEVKKKVRVQLEEEIDPEKLFNDDFDRRIEESRKKAAEAAA